MQKLTYAWRVRRWEETFETHDSRKRKGALGWVAMPTSHEGRGFRELARHEKVGLALGGWYVLLQEAAKTRIRGLLAEHEGPLDAAALAGKTGCPKDLFEAAFEVCSDGAIRWLERVPWNMDLTFEANVSIILDRSKWPPPSEFCRDLLPICRDLPPSAAICRDLPPSAAICRDLPPSAAICRDLPPSAATDRQTDSTDRQTDRQPAGAGALSHFDEEIGLDEAKSLLPALFGRKKNHWSREELGLLDDVLPILRGDYALQKIWFALPTDHPVFQETKRKQSLLTWLREYDAEGDKMRQYSPQFLGYTLNGEQKKRPEPPRWREFFQWAYDDPERSEPITLPLSFWKLEATQRKKYDAEFHKFELAVPKK